MYVPSGAPLPQNSLNGMPVWQQNEMRNCINAWNQAAIQAKRNLYIYPSPSTATAPESNFGPPLNLQKDMQLGQRDGKLAAFTVLTNQVLEPPNNSDIPAPEVVPLNAATAAEFGCDWQKQVLPPAAQPAPRVFLQPAPGGPQVLGGTQPTPPVQQATRTIQGTTAAPVWSPCPPGVPFQGRYVLGAPVCGAMPAGALAPRPSSGPMGYASIVPGMGDYPQWGNAFSAYQENQAVGASLMDMLRSKPWLGLLLAGIGILGISAMGKGR